MKTTDKKHAKAKSSLFMGSSVKASFLRRKKIRKAREKFQELGLYFAPQKKRYLRRRLLRGSGGVFFVVREEVLAFVDELAGAFVHNGMIGCLNAGRRAGEGRCTNGYRNKIVVSSNS
jgi:hypothetical protein